jgi:hypothetical protein
MHAFVRLQPLAEYVAAFLKDGARRLPTSSLPPDTLAALAAFVGPSRLVALATPPQRRPSPGVPEVPGAACTMTLTAAAAAVTAGWLPRELFVGMVTAAIAAEKGETLEAITAALPPGPLERVIPHVGRVLYPDGLASEAAVSWLLPSRATLNSGVQLNGR